MRANEQYCTHTKPRDNDIPAWIKTPYPDMNDPEPGHGSYRTSAKHQCLVNIQAVLKNYNFPSLEPISVEQDRCNFKFSRQFLRVLANACFVQRSFSWCSMKISKHTPIRCYREKILRYSAKITVYGENKIEIVFDEWNPYYGTWQRAGAAFMYILEVMKHRISGHKSDPFKVADDLRGRGIIESRI